MAIKTGNGVPQRTPYSHDDRNDLKPGTENPRVHSKHDLRRGRNATTGEQPVHGYLVDPTTPSLPAVHNNAPFRHHAETVGVHPHTGEYVRPTFPNAERRAAGNAVHTHAPLEPKGQAHAAGDVHYGRSVPPPSRGAHKGHPATDTVHNVHRQRKS